MAKAGSGSGGEDVARLSLEPPLERPLAPPLERPLEPSDLGDDDWLLDLHYDDGGSSIPQPSEPYAVMALSSIKNCLVSIASLASRLLYGLASKTWQEVAADPQFALASLQSLCLEVVQKTIDKPANAVKVLSWAVGLTSGSSLILICSVECIWDAASKAAVKSIKNYYMSITDWKAFQMSVDSGDSGAFVITNHHPENKPIEVLTLDGDFALVASGQSPKATSYETP